MEPGGAVSAPPLAFKMDCGRINSMHHRLRRGSSKRDEQVRKARVSEKPIHLCALETNRNNLVFIFPVFCLKMSYAFFFFFFLLKL